LSKVLAVNADITSEEEVKNLFALVQKTFGRPADVMLNNAGYLKDDQLIGETAPNDWWTGIVSCYLKVV
jgi:NAD(P)-dependent dehydrogenase (short-subunit alcohol dehydrogenase family)